MNAHVYKQRTMHTRTHSKPVTHPNPPTNHLPYTSTISLPIQEDFKWFLYVVSENFISKNVSEKQRHHTHTNTTIRMLSFIVSIINCQQVND